MSASNRLEAVARERLTRKYNRLKSEIAALNNRSYLSPTEEYQKRLMQKQKLAMKDTLELGSARRW